MNTLNCTTHPRHSVQLSRRIAAAADTLCRARSSRRPAPKCVRERVSADFGVSFFPAASERRERLLPLPMVVLRGFSLQLRSKIVCVFWIVVAVNSRPSVSLLCSKTTKFLHPSRLILAMVHSSMLLGSDLAGEREGGAAASGASSSKWR